VSVAACTIATTEVLDSTCSTAATTDGDATIGASPAQISYTNANWGIYEYCVRVTTIGAISATAVFRHHVCGQETYTVTNPVVDVVLASGSYTIDHFVWTNDITLNVVDDCVLANTKFYDDSGFATERVSDTLTTYAFLPTSLVVLTTGGTHQTSYYLR
jgi:hypothetical protein